MVEKKSTGEKIFDGANAAVLAFLGMVFLYPMWFVCVSAFSSIDAIARGQVTIWPVGFNTDAFMRVFRESEIWRAYGNTIFIVVTGTGINLFLTILGAYPLSRKELYGKNLIMILIVFTMYFSGGLIPSYLNVRNLGLYNTIWALIIPGAVSAYNLIVMRTFFQSIPDSLIESAKIDGANDMKVLIRIVLPMSSAVLAVMVLFYAVAHWNSWFAAMIYLRNRKLFPLQLLLREILIEASTDRMAEGVSAEHVNQAGEAIKYATIVIATVPILVIYPFLQKYFVKGVMVGAIKE